MLRNNWRRLSLMLLGSGVAVIAMSQFSSLYQAVTTVSFAIGEIYEQWFQQQSVSNPVLLIGLSFIGGLAASISPCILSMLPVNLSYIGTCTITSRRDALLKASAFVLGVVTVLSILGLFSALAALILVQFKGYFHVAVGLVIIVMALSLAEWIHLPLPQFTGKPGFPATAGRGWQKVTVPYSVGLTFALISSPCTSPIMFAVLAAAGASGSQLYSTLAMVSYALGYTAMIFFASLSAGLVKQSRGWLPRSPLILRLASFSLLLMGGFYLWSGARWILALSSR